MNSPEKLRHPGIGNPPSPEQLFKLAAIGMTNAKKEGKQYKSRRSENAHFFMPSDAKKIEVYDEDEYVRTYHRMVGKVARVGFKHWTMRLAEPNWIRDGNDEDRGHRTTYLFEWTNQGAVRADKHIITKHPDDEPKIDLDDEIIIPELDDRIFQPDFLYTIQEFKVVSEADCQQLIRDMKAINSAPKYELRYNR